MVLRHQKIFSILFAIIFIALGCFTLFSEEVRQNDIVINFTLIIIGITYPLVIFKPQLRKFFLSFEGIIILLIALVYLSFYSNIVFSAIGIFLILSAIVMHLCSKDKSNK
ncbi:MAG: hypothetical protein LBV42_05095 [Methanobrevibacter sp.]|jgi:hypothetical protein|nr:hypothetical protein [Methanobrevibacter sp.]